MPAIQLPKACSGARNKIAQGFANQWQPGAFLLGLNYFEEREERMVHQLICVPVAILFVCLDLFPSLQGDSGGKRFRFFFGFGCFASSHCSISCVIYFSDNLLRKGYKEYRSCPMNSNRLPKRKTKMRSIDCLIQLTEAKLFTNRAKLKFSG